MALRLGSPSRPARLQMHPARKDPRGPAFAKRIIVELAQPA